MPETVLLIERSPGETRAALLRDELVLQVDHYRDHAPSLEDAVFHGRVRRIEAGISAAFVDLDGRREGFLRARGIAGRPKGAPIASLLQEGAAVLVRVVGDAAMEADKLPRLATLDATATAALGASLPVAPACIDPGPPPVHRLLAEHAAVADRIVCNDGPTVRAVRDWLAANGVERDVEQHAGTLFEPFGVEAAIEAALSPRVPLSGGGSLIVEAGETLCAIDVNSGARIAAAGQAATDTNRAAVAEIARQLRLREIAGAIVIDFLKLDRPTDRVALLAALRTALADDPAECHVLGLTALGLVELTRQRRRPALAARLLQPAAPAEPRIDAVACAVLRDLAVRTRRGAGTFALHAAPALIELLRGTMADALAESLSWSHASIALRPDAAMPTGRYVIDETGGA